MSPEQIRWIFMAIVILVLSICVHEWGHAIAADKLGDPTPRSQGRVTLNPAAHADPVGTLVFPLVALLFTGGASLGFGWGKPVQVNPTRFTRKFEMRRSHMLVALAGPLMNVVLAFAIATLHIVLISMGIIEVSGGNGGKVPSSMHEILFYASLLNFILFFFNLIPAPPLDGGAVVEGLLPRQWVPAYQRFAVYGPFVLMAVIFVPGISSIFVKPALICNQLLHTTLGNLLL